MAERTSQTAGRPQTPGAAAGRLLTPGLTRPVPALRQGCAAMEQRPWPRTTRTLAVAATHPSRCPAAAGLTAARPGRGSGRAASQGGARG